MKKVQSALLGKVLLAFAFGALVAFSPTAATADECRPTCRDAKKTCVHAGKAAYRSCKEDCFGARDRRGCREPCRDAWREARTICVGAMRDCRDACDVTPPTPDECEHCKPELRVCLHEVAAEGRTCSRDCLASRAEALRECRRGFFGFFCLLEVATDAARCLHSCSRGIYQGGEGCHATYRQCRVDCQQPQPYGSTSRAFLQPSQNLFD